MAIKSRDEIVNVVKSILGEAPNDDGIVLLEDLSDTLDDYETRANIDWQSERADLERQIQETDRAWRTKYAERFGEGKETNQTIEEQHQEVETVDAEEITYDDLFSEKER